MAKEPKTAKPKTNETDVIGKGIAFTKSIFVNSDALLKEMDSENTENLSFLVASDKIQGRTTIKTERTEDKQKGDNDANTIYTAEQAKLSNNCDTLVASFSLKAKKAGKLHSAPMSVYASFKNSGVMDYLAESGAFKAVCDLYAKQVFSGEWAWRNKEESLLYSVTVTCDNNVVDEKGLSEILFQSIYGDGKVRIFYVTGKFKMGYGSEVYPSQLMKLDEKSEKEKFKEFFKRTEDGKKIYAIRDVKIGNALRRFDTWYKSFATYQTPISVESTGGSIEFGALMREKDEWIHAYLERILSGEALSDVLKEEKDRLYVAAMLVRGDLITNPNNT